MTPIPGSAQGISRWSKRSGRCQTDGAATPSWGDTMKAIVRRQYGAPDVLALRDVARPTPKDDEILVEVRAASVNPYDWHMMTGTPDRKSVV